ncbi:Glycoside hydrolase family 71 protein [Rutstroemia sp. NJR-2017a BBW]|nr:Glycoside hydrolase family 71 protein [Rutstroemia sp. NJR-2017a BBW]
MARNSTIESRLCTFYGMGHRLLYSVVGNTASYSTEDWEDDITQAQIAHIDAFALNIANNDPTVAAQLPIAFSIAGSKGFKLFFSFDYAGNGPWLQADVIALINQYKLEAAYYFYNGQAFVSTFEGVDSAQDWPTIIQDTGCFFIPSWSSLGAKKAMDTGVPNGLFSWGAWPDGPNDMFTTTDYSYFQFLGGKPYMMPASPWFFTNLPGFHKNWLWRGDDMWFDRWTQIWYAAPEFVEIITWNDYGECHYIGPNRANAWSLFDSSHGKAQYNYADGFPHDGWRQFLPYVIDIYKNGAATITEEGLSAWFRPQPASGCTSGGTTGNTASQLQIQYSPAEIVQDKIFFTALLGSTATVKVTVGGVDQGATWTTIPDDNVGLYHGNVQYKGTGPVVVTILRGSTQVAQVSGGSITTACTHSIENWNAWVGSATGPSVSIAAPAYLSKALHCVRGTGPGDYAKLCALACTYDYCPTVCTCTKVGNLRTNTLKATDLIGCPAAGYDITYEGLCSFGCNYGVCPKACTTIANKDDCNPPPASAAPVPFCTAGTGIDTDWNSLCSFTCKYNNCPNQKCICTSASFTANAEPTYSTVTGYPANSDGQDYGLCEWACNRGFCPFPPCSSTAPLAAIGEDVTTNPSYTVSKLAATSSANSVALLAYWTTCQADPQCAPGFRLVGYGHGKVYDADKNAYTADGCTGGSKGYNRAFCVETDVSLGECNWRGTAASCSQTCKAGEFLLTQNTHIGFAKSGCKGGYFSSLCCEKVEIPTKDLVTCPYTNLNNVITGGHGPVVRDISNSKGYLGGYLIPPAECIYNPVGTALSVRLGQEVANGAILNYIPGTWEAHVGGIADFKASQNKPPKNKAKDISGCTTWLEDYHTTTTTVTSTKSINCDEDAWPQACAHYNSVGSVMTQPVITCPWQNQGGKRRPAPTLWDMQHKIDAGNTTRRANDDDVAAILQILSREFVENECEYDEGYYSGPTMADEVPTATWDSPVTSSAVLASSLSMTLTAATTPAATAPKPALTIASSSKKPVPTESAEEHKRDQGVEDAADHKHAHLNHKYMHRHHRKSL